MYNLFSPNCRPFHEYTAPALPSPNMSASPPSIQFPANREDHYMMPQLYPWRTRRNPLYSGSKKGTSYHFTFCPRALFAHWKKRIFQGALSSFFPLALCTPIRAKCSSWRPITDPWPLFPVSFQLIHFIYRCPRVPPCKHKGLVKKSGDIDLSWAAL